MSKPFAVVDVDGLGGQRHEVALDDKPSIFVPKEVRRASWRLLASCGGMVRQSHVGAQAWRRRDGGVGRSSVLLQCGRRQGRRYMASPVQLGIGAFVVRPTQALAAGDGLVKIVERRSGETEVHRRIQGWEQGTCAAPCSRQKQTKGNSNRW
jgi:hypothetical protein